MYRLLANDCPFSERDGKIANPSAAAAARRTLIDVVTQANWTGRPDFDRLEQAIRAVFEPEYQSFARAAGHISAPVTTDAMITVMKARLTAVSELIGDNVSDDALAQARKAHLFAYAEYAARQPVLAAAAPPGQPFYAPVTAEDTLNDCCRNLLTTLGLELVFPANAQLLRRARTGAQLPSPAAVGLG